MYQCIFITGTSVSIAAVHPFQWSTYFNINLLCTVYPNEITVYHYIFRWSCLNTNKIVEHNTKILSAQLPSACTGLQQRGVCKCPLEYLLWLKSAYSCWQKQSCTLRRILHTIENWQLEQPQGPVEPVRGGCGGECSTTVFKVVGGQFPKDKNASPCKSCIFLILHEQLRYISRYRAMTSLFQM